MTNQFPKVKKTAAEVKADLDEVGRKINNTIKRHEPTHRQRKLMEKKQIKEFFKDG
jgi:hypothetical protein